jgi:hypothetical protein
MDDLGRYQSGDVLPAAVQCQTAAGTPDDPADNPVCTIYTPAGAVAERFRLPADLRGVAVGLFRHPLLLSNLSSHRGPHTVHFSWQDSAGNAQGRVAVLTLLPGGDPGGPAVAVRSVRRPHATFLVRQTEAGAFVVGKNPR